jgi:hypothetical protein
MVPSMETRRRWQGLLVALCAAWLLSGCAAKIVNLKPQDVAKPTGLPFEDSVGIETMTGNPGADAELKTWQGDLATVLRKERIFKRVDDPYRSDRPTNLLLRGKVTGEFRGRGGYGFLNFLTWFPGPFILMHHWRGTRFEYAARADVELVETETRRVVGNYTAETAHKLIHQSSTPGPFFAALVVIPGVVKAINSTWPRPKYRQMICERAYEDLWQLVAARIARDRVGYYADRRERRRKHCGDRLGADPVVGSTWEEFEACQLSKFMVWGQEASDLGTVTVYVNADRSLEIHVVDGRIVRWVVP